MRKLKLVIISGIILLGATKITAQTVEKGFLTYDGDVNFAELAKYELAHPPKIRVFEPKDEDEMPNFKPFRPDIDPALSPIYKPKYKGGIPSMPVSPSPSDTFQSSTSDGSIPPDTHGAVGGSNFVITADNSYIRIQNRTGGTIANVSLGGWWGISTMAYDPRVHFDPYKKIWIMVTDDGGAGSSNRIRVAVSATSDPTGTWHKYSISIGSATQPWLDFPNVGFNSKWVVITGNMFSQDLLTTYGAKVYVIDYAAMIAGTGAPFTAFTQSSSFTICPALTYSATEPNIFCLEEYHDYSGQLQMWKISGTVSSPTMTVSSWPHVSTKWVNTAYTYSSTPGIDFAPQVGTTKKVQTNDDRINNLIYRNGYLWTAHTAFLPYSATANPTRSSIMWWQMDTNGVVQQNGLIDDPTNTNFFAFPSIAVNANNDVLIGFARMSASTHPSAAYALRYSSDPTDSIRPYVVYRHGISTYYVLNGGSKNRWGDYSGTCVDTNDIDFWTDQESVRALNAWDTWWAHIKVPLLTTNVITGATSVCTGSTITLVDTVSGGTWSCSNGNATISSTGVVTGVTAGTVVVSYSTSSSGTATANITVKPTPHPVVTQVGFTLSVPAVYSSYQWIKNGSNIPGAVSSSYVFSVTGTGTYQITVDSGGCTGTSSPIIFSLSPITGPNTVCAGSTIKLVETTTGGTWSKTTNKVTFTVTGDTCKVTGGATAGVDTIKYTVGGVLYAESVINVIKPNPVIRVLTLDTLSVVGSYLSYQWLKNGTNIPAATNSYYIYGITANYQVIVDSIGCYDTTSARTYRLGINEIASDENSFRIGQDGSKAILFADFPVTDNISISIYNATGKLVKQETWIAGADSKQISAAWLPSGLYIIKLSNKNTSTFLKWIKG